MKLNRSNDEHIVRRVRGLAIICACAVAVGSCGGPLGPEDLARIELAAGNNQEAPAGTAVPTPPAVRALSADGEPVPGAVITFTVTDGGGTLTGAQATSNAEGIAAVTSWVLGTEVGQNVLNATAELAPERIPFLARGVVGPAATIEKLEGDGQTVTAGLAVPTSPTVRISDQFANVIPDLEITFAIGSGGGAVSQSTATTDASGVANAGSWTLGGAPGANTLIVTAGPVNETFTATGEPGPVAVNISLGDSQTTTVGSPFATNPRVLVIDGLDLPVPGVTVDFAIVGGGGSIDAQQVNTDANGFASVQWTAGNIAGPNSLTATVTGLGSVNFAGTGVPDAPASITAASGDGQFGAVNLPLPAPPSALVEDQFGNAVANVSVTFAVTAGGGTVEGSPATTDANGIATAGTWTLGGVEGPNTVDATVTGVTPFVFTATGLASVFDVEVIRLGAGGPGIAQAIDDAAARWEQMIIGDLVDESFVANPVDSAACGVPHPPINDVVDDVRIFVQLEEIDGPGNILGSAGPCFIRASGLLTVIGVMRFDTDDLANLEASGRLEDVVVHEIGHVLGIGTLWDDFGLLQNPSLPGNEGADTHFDGAQAIAAFDAAGGTNFTAGSKVPVENTQGGAGTRDSHWRESVFETELMTGFVDATNELSAITTESLEDLGYIVNSSAADAYQLPGATPPGARVVTQLGIPLVDDVRRGPIYVVERGGKIKVVLQR